MASRGIIVFASQWGSTEKVAHDLASRLKLSPGSLSGHSGNGESGGAETRGGGERGTFFQICSFAESNVWYEESVEARQPVYVLLLIGTNEGGTIPTSCKAAYETLMEEAYDRRADFQGKDYIRYAVVGFGDSAYGKQFCTPAVEVNRCLKIMGWRRDQRLTTINSGVDALNDRKVLRAMANLGRGVEQMTAMLARLTLSSGGNGVGAASSAESDGDSDSSDDGSDTGSIEDAATASVGESGGKRMLSEKQRQTLQKQGYKLVGKHEHSAVKLCRWVRSDLKGAGGCYKQNFYGIQSRNCMEATPSLMCSSRCTFCWRRKAQPVGRHFASQVDDPSEIVEESIRKHLQMIKELRGAKGVEATGRLESAMTVRHCALSLVGEPIMYPKISELVVKLHQHRISSFLVTNAQFPEAMETLSPCTQFYVSVDAATRESLKAIDRPLFEDFYERFLACLGLLRKRMERTVFRLTLVKGQNVNEISDYAALVKIGHPNLIEIKGVTFTGPGGELRMENVPFYEEVLEFAQQLLREIKAIRLACGPETDMPNYELSCGHEHSCSVLIADTRFLKSEIKNPKEKQADEVLLTNFEENKTEVRNSAGPRWHTWIDYSRFFDLEARFRETGESFSAFDYCCLTPSWALIGSKEKGFNPSDTATYTQNRMEAAKLAKEKRLAKIEGGELSTCCSGLGPGVDRAKDGAEGCACT